MIINNITGSLGDRGLPGCEGPTAGKTGAESVVARVPDATLLAPYACYRINCLRLCQNIIS